MSTLKPSIPKGTRDITPEQYAKRKYIFDTVENVFKKHGFKPIETPAMELLSTLTGKYGNEGDKLIFKILNSGNFLSSVKEEDYKEKDTAKLTSQLSEKALRYDLTVPFARFVVQHQNDISFPFKRYQIQPVWRADKPQRGRYREFFQCDIDVIGSNSLINEAELLKITDDIFTSLGIKITIKINNRKILAGIAEVLNIGDKIIDFTTALDKLDKIGRVKVEQELRERHISEDAIEKISQLILISESNNNLIEAITALVETSEVGMKGIAEITEIFDYAAQSNIKSDIIFDVTLARGLNYYTGAILEVKSNDLDMGSISGGGRYDDLTGIFGLKDVSGVGISFGADRIYDVMEGLNLFPDSLSCFTKVLFLNLGTENLFHIFPLIEKLRNMNIACELYPDNVKMKKQMSYADKNNIPYVVIIGEEERNNNVYTIKNMHSGEQVKLNFEKALDYFV